MPITVKLKSTRLTNDQHRVEVTVADASSAQRAKLHSEEAPDARDVAAPSSAQGSITFDVRLTWKTDDFQDSGFSHPPESMREDAPEPGRKTVEWRGFGLGETRSFLARRARPGAYTVDVVAEAHLRVVADAAGTTLTFPPTP
jgi:hypothetical protein